MQEKNARSLAWFASLLVFFPLWISAQHLFSNAVSVLELNMPDWLYGFFTLLILGGVLLGVAYASAFLLNRKYPNSPARSANWQDQ
jgi:hypothetical protein